MCFSAEASLGVAVALLPVGGYCVEAAWRKDRAYLPLAAVPGLFGLQQLCAAAVWTGVGRGDAELTRAGSLAFLFFALAFWPVWIPLAGAAIDRRGRRERWRGRMLLAFAGLGLLLAAVCYLPIAAGDGRALNPVVVGHSLRYDLTAVPMVDSSVWWVWPGLYLAAVCGPLLVSRDRYLHPLGVVVALAAAVSYALFERAFASVWCFCAAVLSAHLAYVLARLPAPPTGNPEPTVQPSPSN